jgi:hypothetical protein
MAEDWNSGGSPRKLTIVLLKGLPPRTANARAGRARRRDPAAVIFVKAFSHGE